MQTGKTVMTSFYRIWLCALSIAACATGEAAARDCGSDALRVSRTIVIGRTKGGAVGLQSYPQTLDLQDKEIVLTFDDGPAPGPTTRILDALAKECALATFFVIGRNSETSPDIVKREANDGHSVGHHSYSHPGNTLRLMADAAAKADIEKGIAAVEKASGGKAAPFFRFPGFADTKSLRDYLDAKGFTVFGSDLWASDWSPMSPKGELDLVMKRLEKEGKGIVLFHDSKAQTAAMIPDFLRELKARGYRLVHIVPGEGETPVAPAGPGWTSTTEPIIAKTLKGKTASPPGAGDAGEGHTHPSPDP